MIDTRTLNIGIVMKSCFKCGAEKPLSEFYRHKMMADGHLNKCKTCAKKDVRDHRKDPKFREKVLAYDRKRGNRQGTEYQKKYRDMFPKKAKAKQMVNNFIRSGKMKRETVCVECGSDFAVQAHHDDYDYPLSVRWLCSACHRQWHAENGEGRNGR